MRILVVEDEVAISDGICAFLANSGYNCIQAFNGEQALLKFEQNEIDFVLLDIMLPKKSGLEVLQLIRKQSEVPVLILTALSDDETKIAAFNTLADGFINKPFSLAVLAARIEAIYRRRNPVNEGWKYKNLEVDFVNYVATVAGQKIKINPKELEVLKVLVNNQNQILTRSQIIEKAWSYDEEIPLERVVDVYIKSLRKKLGLDCIVTVKNVGYKLELR
jgi:DNA-binding response regulator vncR